MPNFPPGSIYAINPAAFFNAADWYWVARNGSVYSSKRNALVYSYDPLYLACVAQWGPAPPWPVDASGNQTGASMQAALAMYGVNAGLTIPNP